MRGLLHPFLATVAMLVAACGGNEPSPPPRTPQAVSVLQGDNQQAPVGTRLPVLVVFRVTDRQGPLGGVRVAFLTSDVTGFPSVSSATTGPDGTVEVGWTVGGTVGQQTLTATVAGITPALARASVDPGPPALVTPATTPSQFVVVGRQVIEVPAARVTDAFGNPLAGQEVSFADPTGRSTVEGAPSTTDATGVAGITAWRIGTQPGAYSLVASIASGATTTFVAFGTPATVLAAAGGNQSANAGTLLPTAPAIRALDDAGQGLAEVSVKFVVASGGGRILGTETVATDATGLAVSTGWVLGPAPGPNELRAEIQGTPPTSFSATGLAAVAGQAAAASATSLVGVRGNFVTPTPAISVVDAGGQPVAGVPVAFTITSGGGSLARANRITDFQGRAELGGWRLGPSEGTGTITAAAEGVAPVVFTATAGPPPASAFTIDVRFTGPAPTQGQQAAFAAAAARWQTVVLGDLEDVPFNSNEHTLDFCGGQTLVETIDDVIIFASIEDIDGAGGILGQAGACYLRDDNLLTVIGRMRFDLADVVALQTAGRFQDVVLHEMGHVLGVGSLWQLLGLVSGRGGVDPAFTGASARAAWAAVDGGEVIPGMIVPVENNGGPGTRDVHWRESAAGNELMTGFIDDGPNPLSAVTVASLRDEGYAVDDAAADPYTLAAALRALEAGTALRLVEQPAATLIRTIDRQGTVRRVFMPTVGPRLP